MLRKSLWMQGQIPQDGIELDSNNPLSHKVLFAFPQNNREIITHKFLNAAKTTMTNRGPTLHGNGSTSAGTVALDFSSTAKITIAFWMFWDSFANDDRMAFEFSPNTNTKQGGFNFDPNDSAGTLGFYVRCGAQGKYTRFPRPSGGVWHHYVATCDKSLAEGIGGWTLNIDGVPSTPTVVYGTTDTNNFRSDTLYLFSRGGSSLFGTGKIQGLIFYGDLLTETEKLNLYLDHFSVYRPKVRSIAPFGVVAGIQTLTPSLYTDADTFYAATASPGAVTLTPSLYTDVDTFHAATVSTGTILQPSLYTDADTFHAATVTPGTVTLTPSLYTDADTFYVASVTQGLILQPSLFTDTDTFYAATVSPGAVTLTPSVYTDADTFHAATVTQGNLLQPSLYVDADTFYAATVATGAVILTPSLYTDTDTFHAATVTSEITLAPSLYSDADTFHAATVTSEITLAPSLYSDTDTFHAHVVTAEGITLLPNLYTNTNIFYAAFLSGGSSLFTPSIFRTRRIAFENRVRKIS